MYKPSLTPQLLTKTMHLDFSATLTRRPPRRSKSHNTNNDLYSLLLAVKQDDKPFPKRWYGERTRIHQPAYLLVIHRRSAQHPPKPTSQATADSIRNHIPPAHALLLRLRAARAPKTIDARVHTSRALARGPRRRMLAPLPSAKRESVPAESARGAAGQVEHADGGFFLDAPGAQAAHLAPFLAEEELWLLVREAEVAGQLCRGFAAVGAVVEVLFGLGL